MIIERDNGSYISPYVLFSTQDTECPANNDLRPYHPDKDESGGVTIAIDENGDYWLLDGHRRAGAARLNGKLLKVGRINRVSSRDMWLLAEG